MTSTDPIVEMIGRDNFIWISESFSRETTLRDIPDHILERLSSIDITIRDYGRDRNAITAIAVLTFAYKMAEKTQKAQDGAKDLTLLKVLAKNERLRRERKIRLEDEHWRLPVFEMITGVVGERIRSTPIVNSPK
jgi:hypothetical protein